MLTFQQKFKIFLNSKDFESNRSSLVVLVADHGMADQGGHGASSTMEVKTPLFMFNTKHEFPQSSAFKEYKQIDFAPTMSCLFNLKIPVDNEGVAFISEFVDSHNTIDQKLGLQCLLKNFLQLNENFHLTKEMADIDQKITQTFSKNVLEHDDTESLRMMSMNLENILRSTEVDSKSKSHDQTSDLLMQLALLLMFAVRLCLLVFQLG
jgi:hypothetical protein